jgi:prophage regulatory protein
MEKTTKRIIRKPEMLARVGVSDTTLWRMERDGKFPKRRTIGAGVAGWISTEVDHWFETLEEKVK